MRYFKQLVGKQVYLTPPSIDDASKYCKWLNNLEIVVNLQSDWNLSVERERELLTNLINQPNVKLFGIVNNKTDELLGSCGLHDIDLINDTAQFGIFIGDKEYHGKGYGTEATQLILDFGFNILNLYNIYLYVYSYNEPAIKSYMKAGFKEIGRRRKARHINGERYDIVYMDIIRDEFTSPFVDKIMSNI